MRWLEIIIAFFRNQRYTDREILDYLQERLERAPYTGRCVLRESSTGRGFRLMETSRDGAFNDVREAVMHVMDEEFDFGCPDEHDPLAEMPW